VHAQEAVATAWKVPAQTSPASRTRVSAAQMRATRRVISAAARRVKVKSRMRRGSAPRRISAATRWARVWVLPEPAPATTSSGSSP